MIKVIEKVFDILALLAEAPEQPRPLSEIAGRLSMHPATCANILKTLIDRDFVEQAAPKKGYTLGPAVYFLARSGPYRKDLVGCARPIMESLAASVNETVMLVVLRNGRRFILSVVDGSQAVKVSGEHLLHQDNVYRTATGRLLLAYLPEADMKKFLARHALPGSEWPEAGSSGKLARATAEIRKRGNVCYNPTPDITGLAFPVVGPGGDVIASLGMFLPSFRFKGGHRRNVLREMKKAAESISREFSDKR